MQPDFVLFNFSSGSIIANSVHVYGLLMSIRFPKQRTPFKRQPLITKRFFDSKAKPAIGQIVQDIPRLDPCILPPPNNDTKINFLLQLKCSEISEKSIADQTAKNTPIFMASSSTNPCYNRVYQGGPETRHISKKIKTNICTRIKMLVKQ